MTNIIKEVEGVAAITTACYLTTMIYVVAIPVAAVNGVTNTVGKYAKNLKKMYKEEKKKASYTVNWISVD